MRTIVGLSLAIAASSAIAGHVSNDTEEPEFELLRRQGLAAVYSKCTTPNTVALTFDDGPYLYTKKIVDILDQNGAKGTFFVNGKNYRCIYEDDMISNIRYAFDHGHLFGSHTFAHRDLTEQSWDKIHDEMWRVELAMMRILGVSPAYMRPPYGKINDMVRAVSKIRNQSIVTWDFDSGDSVGRTAQQSKDLYRGLADRHPSNVLTLNHETKESTVYEVLPYAIQLLKAKGYQFVTVSKCLGKKRDYQKFVGRGEKDASWGC